MEKVGRSVNVSLRYSLSQRSFENEASSSATERLDMVRNSDEDVDFDDVFGGPPTRTRYSFGGGRIKSSEESSSSPVGLGERPVFGESYSSPRKRTSDDFYNDIFRRSDESVRSPSSDFSLSAKMTKAVDIPVFGSNVHSPNASLSRFSSSQTLFSRATSSVKESESVYSTQTSENEADRKSMNRTRTGSPTNEFHFSIHKWANVGVPLLMSLRGGKHPTLKGSSKVSSVSIDNMQDTGFPSEDLSTVEEDMDLNTESGIGVTKVIEKETLILKQEVKAPEVIPPNSILHDEIERQGYEEARREVEAKENVETNKKKVSSKKAEANKHVVGSPKSSPKSRVKGMVKDFFKMSTPGSPPKTKPTKPDVIGRSSRWKTTAKTQIQEEVDNIIANLDTTVPEDNVEKKPDASSTTKSASQLSAENVKMAPKASTTIPLASKGPAENVKMAPKASSTIPLASKLPAENVKMDPKASSTIPLSSKVPAENVKMAPKASTTIPLASKAPSDNIKIKPDASFMAKEDTGKSNKQKFPQNRTIRKLEDINFQKGATPASESVPNVSKASVDIIDNPSLDNFQVEELATVEDEHLKTEDESEAIKALDSKIHLWSSGRKGNIRSLLSTLQLVLWANSGWKPVALVDIIESNAVKKSYNRAMLCLHPDKLQQKGADSHKKYVAEKVFDILQEAWDHFNTLGTLL